MTGQPDNSTQSTQSTNEDASQNFTELRAAVTQVGQLGQNVRDGKVTLDPAVGAKLLSALRSHADDVGDWQRQVGQLAQPLPMGNNPVGTSMGEKFSQRADGHGTALATVLAQYRSAVTDAGDAVEQAMQLYASNEDNIQQAFGRISAT